MKNILVGIDFNDNTDIILDKTIKLASPFMPRIWLLHVAAPNPDFIGYEIGPQYIRDYRAKELREEHSLLTQYAKKLRDENFEVDGLLIPGPTVEVVLSEIEKLNIDFLICGHQEHSFLYSTIFGNISTDLVKKSKIPILVIPS